MVAPSCWQKLQGTDFSGIIKTQRHNGYEPMAANLKQENGFMEARAALGALLHSPPQQQQDCRVLQRWEKATAQHSLPNPLPVPACFCQMHVLIRAGRKTIGGNYRNLPAAKPQQWQCQHKVAHSLYLWFTRLEELNPKAQLLFCVSMSLHHAAPSMSGGENTKSFNSSAEAVFWCVQSCPKAADV